MKFTIEQIREITEKLRKLPIIPAIHGNYYVFSLEAQCRMASMFSVN